MDRTKMGRPNERNYPQAITGKGGDDIRSAYNQNTDIPRGFGDPLLETRAVQSVGNQQAGAPGAVDFLTYTPTGSSSVKRKGLDGDSDMLPKPKY